MNILEALKSNSEEGVDIGKKYIDASYKYGKLKTFKILTYSLSAICKLFFIGSFLSAGLIFLSVAGAIALGNYFNNISLGYLTIGLLLSFIGLIVYLLRKKIIDKIIISELSQQFFDSNK